MHYDLIIIGMGLSGLIAARTAAESGRKVLVIGKGMGCLTLFSNTIDVLGKIPETTRLRDGLSQWIQDHPDHPYSKVGLTGIAEGLSSFTSLFHPPYSFQTIGDGNCFLPTGAGTMRPTHLVPDTMVAGASAKEKKALIVGFKGFRDFYAEYIAGPLKWRGITLPLPDTPGQEISATTLSRWMEKGPFRETIGQEIKKNLSGETCVGFPAILGMNHPMEVKMALEEKIGVEVFEIPTLPPSIPGMRIFNRFKEWLIRKGVTFLLGHSVAKVSIKNKRCEGVYVFNPPVSNFYSADRFILATGRFIGGGLMADRERISEPIFNLPVIQPKSREEWFGNSFFNDSPHPIHLAGVLTDSSLRPVDEGGDLILENVWVAGSILTHHHYIDEKSREGIELATGYAAAKRAVAK
ncbi:MAG: anaerobic glycerol-3-phosphate dehydrogenase subunit GlpB [Deltaproteobacteria bacterium]|nr:anaerobic glycerol-3-phosphate dehydrogenase subunit GlpB [Deltaproteobacteria bacterium]